MSQVDRQTVACFMRLKAPEFDAYREYVSSVYRKALEDMAQVSDPDMWKQLKGRAKLAKELLDFVESSSTLAAKFESRRGQP